MAYIFKKLENLTSAPTASGGGGTIIDGSTGQKSSQIKANPYASTFRSPSNVYNANLGENMGQVETGLNKNIEQTTKDLNNSTQEYGTKLKELDSQFQFNPQDLQNISDSGAFSRLSQLVNPQGAQTEFKNQKSNTGNYNLDTQGVAQSSTVNGLSSQLKNQYGTTAGGSRLDALLYRNSGQAGAGLQNNYKQIDDFKANQTGLLGKESALLGQYNQGLLDRSSQVKTQGEGLKNQFMNDASSKSQQLQSQYDAQRNAYLDSARNTIQNNPYQDQLRQTINQAFGINPIAAQRPGRVGAPAADTRTAKEKAADEFFNFYKNRTSFSDLAPEQFVSGTRQFNQNDYLDPRFNQLGQLLGSQQYASSGGLDPNATYDSAKLQEAINARINPQLDQAKSSVAEYLASGGQGGSSTLQQIMQFAPMLATPGLYGNIAGGQAISGVVNNPGINEIINAPSRVFSRW